MLINSTLYMVVAIALPFIIVIGGAWLLYKKLGKWGILIPILVAAFTWAASQMAATHLYIVEDCNQWSDYRVFGSLEYDLRNGKKVTIPYEPRKVVVLNNSENELVLEELIYGAYMEGFSAEPEVSWIVPATFQTFELPKMQIDFFFDETIPEEIEEYGSGSKSKYWLYCE
jgi:hypothetical protein